MLNGSLFEIEKQRRQWNQRRAYFYKQEFPQAYRNCKACAGAELALVTHRGTKLP
jgi:hypothetical protein